MKTLPASTKYALAGSAVYTQSAVAQTFSMYVIRDGQRIYLGKNDPLYIRVEAKRHVAFSGDRESLNINGETVHILVN